jgi:hypothetical protein
MAIAQQMKDHEEARRQQRRLEREAYDKLTPEEQAEKIKKLTAQDLVDLGLAIPAGDTVPQGPVEPNELSLEAQKAAGEKTTGIGPWKKKWVIRKDAIRGHTLEELAKKKQAELIVQNADADYQLERDGKELANKLTKIQLEQGTFNYDKARRDDKQMQEWKTSKNPTQRAIALGIPLRDATRDIMREKYPELASVSDEIEAGFGPSAEKAQYAKYLQEAEKEYVKSTDARLWADAMTDATMKGKFEKLDNLPKDMQTFALKRLQNESASLELRREEMYQSRQLSINTGTMQFLAMTDNTVSPDTANQIMKHLYFGNEKFPLTAGAKADLERWRTQADAAKQMGAASALFDLNAKRGKALNESMDMLRDVATSLIQMHKEDLGDKNTKQQIQMIQKELVAQVTERMGLDPSQAQSTSWIESVTAGANVAMGSVQMAGAAAMDKADEETSFFKDVFKDVVGPKAVEQLRATVGAVAGSYGGAARQFFGLTESPQEFLERTGSSASKTASGEAELKIKGYRVWVVERLSNRAQELIVKRKTVTDPATIATIDENLRVIADLIKKGNAAIEGQQ